MTTRPDHLICPFCKRAGLTSVVMPGYSTSTAIGWQMGYYDEEGNYIENTDPNITTSHFSCSNGHFFGLSYQDGVLITDIDKLTEESQAQYNQQQLRAAQERGASLVPFNPQINNT